jgi:16S rRNA (adenine1518-N6/adenine1519-N6)-dimethyltransferase
MQHNFKKQFGQNFLQHAVWVERLVDSADLTSEDLVVEIGPGEGVVTERLAQCAKQVLSLEIDPELIPVLNEKFQNYDNIKIIPEDILQWDISILNGKKYKVVASLPYNISKKIINLFLRAENPPIEMALLIQKEVAYDYVAKKPDAKFLGVVAQIYADIELTTTIPRNAFFPMPKVDGGVLRFTNIKPKVEKPEELIKFIKIGFSAPRKKLSGNLANLGYDKQELEALFLKLNFSATARPQELDLSDWQELYQHISEISRK